MGRPGTLRVSAAAMDALLAHDWPGNVRELENWLQYALVKCRGDAIGPEHLPPAHLASRRAAAAAPPAAPPPAARRPPLNVERVREALARTGGNRRDAARELGVARATLYRFFEAHRGEFGEEPATS